MENSNNSGVQEEKIAVLTLNGVPIESRLSDCYINATQLCRAGGKKFNNWFQLDSTKELTKILELNTGIPVFKIVDTKKGRYSESWIHPDLAVQLAQWISPLFAIQVSRWIRELLSTGSVSVNSNKSDEELKKLQREYMIEKQNRERAEARLVEKEQNEARLIEEKEQAKERETQLLKEKEEDLTRLHRINAELLTFKKFKEKNESIYFCTSYHFLSQGLVKIGRTKDIKTRSAGHNTTHPAGDKTHIIAEFKVNDSVLVEKTIHKKLEGLRPERGSEFFMGPLNSLKSIVQLIVDNDDGQNEVVNQLIDLVYSLKSKKFEISDWVEAEELEKLLDQNEAPMQLVVGERIYATFNCKNMTEEDRQRFARECVELFARENNAKKVNWIRKFRPFFLERLNTSEGKFRLGPWRKHLKKAFEENSMVMKWR